MHFITHMSNIFSEDYTHLCVVENKNVKCKNIKFVYIYIIMYSFKFIYMRSRKTQYESLHMFFSINKKITWILISNIVHQYIYI